MTTTDLPVVTRIVVKIHTRSSAGGCAALRYAPAFRIDETLFGRQHKLMYVLILHCAARLDNGDNYDRAPRDLCVVGLQRRHHCSRVSTLRKVPT